MSIVSSNPVSAFTGIPSGGKSRRGKRSRGKTAKPTGLGVSKTTQHFDALKGAMATGDHASAKIASLHLANALHSMNKKTKVAGVPSPMAGGFNPGTVADGQNIVQGQEGGA